MWWAPVQSPDEVLQDVQLLQNDGVVEVPDPRGGAATTSVNSPVTFRGRGRPRVRPAPRLGEHNGARFDADS